MLLEWDLTDSNYRICGKLTVTCHCSCSAKDLLTWSQAAGQITTPCKLLSECNSVLIRCNLSQEFTIVQGLVQAAYARLAQPQECLCFMQSLCQQTNMHQVECQPSLHDVQHEKLDSVKCCVPGGSGKHTPRLVGRPQHWRAGLRCAGLSRPPCGCQHSCRGCWLSMPSAPSCSSSCHSPCCLQHAHTMLVNDMTQCYCKQAPQSWSATWQGASR